MTKIKLFWKVSAYVEVEISDKLEPGKDYQPEDLHDIAIDKFNENCRLYEVQTNELNFKVWNPKEFETSIIDEYDIL